MKILTTLIFFLLSITIGGAQQSETENNTRIRVAVVDFQAKGVSQTDASILTDRFRAILVNNDSLRVFERENVDKILEEQGFQQSGSISDESMVELGKLIGVEKIISGSVSLISRTYTVTAKLIDIKTGEIEKSSSVDHRGSIDDLLSEGMKLLASRLFGGSPYANLEYEPDTQTITYSDSDYTPLQIAFINPVQIFHERKTVTGLKVNIFYGLNYSVYGVDAGLLNSVKQNVYGIQAGLVNNARHVIGLQAGLINVTDTMFGLQVGLLNTIHEGLFPFMPFINAGFSF